eukprot:gene3266-6463_t
MKSIFVNFVLAQFSISHALNGRVTVKMVSNRPLNPQANWGLREKKPLVTVLDLVSVLGRFNKRSDFYEGEGYSRPSKGFLTQKSFYETISSKKFTKWPEDEDGNLLGATGLTKQEIDIFRKNFENSVSQSGADAVFTTFAKGATNGFAYPAQVDEEMKKWLQEDGSFSLTQFEKALNSGRLSVLLGWFLYIGLQFGGIYVVFFVPIMSHFYPDIDYYPIQTFLHTSEW